MNKTYFIADVAANHDGDIERAKKLCLLAKKAGADAAKFQHFKAKTIVSDKGFKDLGSQQSHQANWEKSIYEVYNDASVPLDWTPELKSYCDKIGIDFFTTPYDLDYVDYLDQFVSCYKIGSGDITWHKMLHKVASKGKPVIIATGASNIQEVIDAVKILGAVTLGATMIEKHFTDDNDRNGPDHPFSMNPQSWKNMVDRTRLLEISLGSPIKTVEENENETIILQRRSIRINKNLLQGHIITSNDIFEVRPCPSDAIPASKELIGKTLLTDLNKNNYLKYEHIR